MIHILYDNIVNTLLVLSLIILIVVVIIRKAINYRNDQADAKYDFEKELNKIDDDSDKAIKNNRARNEKNKMRIEQTANFRQYLFKLCSNYDKEHWYSIYEESDENSAFYWFWDKKLPSFDEMCDCTRPLITKEWFSEEDITRLKSKYIKPAAKKKPPARVGEPLK